MELVSDTTLNSAIFRGIQNAIGTIVFMFFFLFISVYCFSSICFYFMQPNIKANCSKEGPGYNSDFCKLYFNNSFISFFTLFQLMTGDNWSDVYVDLLTGQKDSNIVLGFVEWPRIPPWVPSRTH